MRVARVHVVLALLNTICSALRVQDQNYDVSSPDIPLLGFGTWNLDPSDASEAVATALKTGYRHIDCAAIYGNEKEVGHGIKLGAEEANVKREELWITSKLWNDHHRPDLVSKALDNTLADLGLEYIDLYLMHWPVGEEDSKTGIDYINTWTAMKDLLASGRTRHIGVSNFSPAEIAELLPIAKPSVHQFETHPYLQQREFLAFHKAQGIHVTAYSPLGNQNPIYTSSRKEASGQQVPQLLENETIKRIAEIRRCTPAQVVLKWGMSRGTSVIPKSQQAHRIAENWASSKCELQVDDVEKIEQSGMAVKRFNNPSASWNVTLYKGLQDGGEPHKLDDDSEHDEL